MLSLFILPIILGLIGTTFVFPFIVSSFVKIIYWLFCICFYFWTNVLAISSVFDEQFIIKDKYTVFVKSLKLFIYLSILLLITTNTFKNVVDVNNQIIYYKANYNQLEQSHKTLYDEMWKSYQQQNDIATINKDVFLETVRIQMESRKDGMNTAWKWVNENTHINHSTYSQFYSNLSNFILVKRNELRKLEENKQQLVKEYNIYINKFPNNIYTFFLHVEPLKYEYGFLSYKTNDVFNKTIENLK